MKIVKTFRKPPRMVGSLYAPSRTHEQDTFVLNLLGLPVDVGSFLPSTKSAVNASLECSEGALLVFGVILTVGIFGEYSKAEKWKARKRAFEIMVMVGLAGELLADGGIFVFSRKLQTISDSELVAMGRRLQQTNEHLVTATNGLRDALSAATDTLKGDIDSTRTDARTSISDVFDKMTHRHLTPEQKQKLIRKFSGYRHTPVQIELINPDDESEGLARQLQPVFPLAKISSFSSRVRFKGMQVIELRGSNHFDSALAGALESALNEIFPDVAPRTRLEPDWGERINPSGEFFEPPYLATIELAIGRRQT